MGAPTGRKDAITDSPDATVGVDALPSVEIFGVKVHGPTLEQAAAII